MSRIGLGTNMFGPGRGWGVEERTAREILHRYVELGGNLIDTANVYTHGESEALLGKFLADWGSRERMVLATKFSFSNEEGDPNSEGNGRKNIYRSLEESLRRLQTSYVDLYWLHAWDELTPVEEVVSTLDQLVGAGKIRYYGFSNAPTWYAARAYTVAERLGMEPPIALQLQYSLIDRTIERDHIPMARVLGLGICPWSPLGGGFLTGKYSREENPGPSRGRLDHPRQSASREKRFSDRNWRILDVLRDAARELDKPVTQVGLNWVATQPGVSSTLVGASNPEQVTENAKSLDFSIPGQLRRKLDAVSAIDSVEP